MEDHEQQHPQDSQLYLDSEHIIGQELDNDDDDDLVSVSDVERTLEYVSSRLSYTGLFDDEQAVPYSFDKSTTPRSVRAQRSRSRRQLLLKNEVPEKALAFTATRSSSDEDYIPAEAVHQHAAPMRTTSRPVKLALFSFVERLRRGNRDDDDEEQSCCGVHRDDGKELLIGCTGNSSSRDTAEESNTDDSRRRMKVFKHRADGVKSRQVLAQKRRRCIVLCIVLGVLMITVGIVVGVVVGMKHHRKKSPTMTIAAPKDEDVDFVGSVVDCYLPADIDSYQASEGMKKIRSTIVAEFPSMASTIDSPGTSARAALCWIADVDRFGVSGASAADVMIQRFAMGLIYYHFVLDLDPKSDSKLPASNWLYAIHECEWDYVDCDGRNEVVVGLHMSQLDLGGSMPLLLLKGLTTLELFANFLVGTMPSELWAMNTRLETLDVGSNLLSGTIASEIRNLQQLRNLSVQSNRLTGTMPNLSDLPKLERFAIANDQLVGMFPNLEGTTNLETIFLYGLQLSGTISSSLGSLTKLTTLYVGGMELVGSIPTEIGMLMELRTLRLADMTITGSIPTELGLLTHLTQLELSRNRHLSGSVPSEIGLLTNLEQLLFEETTRLTGSMPSEVCSLFSQKLTSFSTCSMSCPDM